MNAVTQRIASHFSGGIPNGKGGIKVLCPCHEDTRPSLEIDDADNGGAVLKCWAGCENPAILAAVGLKMSDPMPERDQDGNRKPVTSPAKPKKSQQKFPTAEVAVDAYRRSLGTETQQWTYRDADGKPGIVVTRWDREDGKEFRPTSRIGDEWILGGLQENRPLYNLPEILAADPMEWIHVAEGEKCADVFETLGLIGTTSSNGAGSAGKSDWGPLSGRRVAIFPDNDPAGENYAAEVVGILEKLDPPPEVVIVRIPGLPKKGDVFDWSESRDAADAQTLRGELFAMIEDARADAAGDLPTQESEEPVGWCGDEPDFEDGDHTSGMTPAGHYDSRMIRNANVTGEGKEKIVEPIPMDGIIGAIRTHTGDWPRVASGGLFVQEGDQVQWLNNAAALCGWLGTRLKSPAKFYSSVGCHSREEVFCELKRTAIAYKAIETLPHEPAMVDHYYTCKFPSAGGGSKLEELLDRFSPETAIDRQLLKALIASRFWGGDGLIRPCPAFVLTSPDGRGAGKTKTAQLIAELGGGFMSFALHEKIDDIMKRLLSPEGLKKSFGLLDNVKNRDVSWADLEGLITASEISGKAMYVGEASRPNNLLWVLTLNGVGLSTDMAQRCCIISLSKPQYSGTWEEDTRRFITQHQQEIIGDVIGFLRSPRKELTRYSRWGMWERDVLSRLPDPMAAQSLILERQNVADVGREESEVIQDHIREQLQGLGYWTDRERIFIPSSVLCRWVNWATGEKLTVVAAGRMIRQGIDEGKLPLLQDSKSNTYGRGVVWVGEEWDCESEMRTDVECRIRERSSKGF